MAPIVMRTIRILRESTLEEVGDAVGITRSAAQQIEKNRLAPSRELRGRLSEYFGVPWAVLSSSADEALKMELISFIVGRCS